MLCTRSISGYFCCSISSRLRFPQQQKTLLFILKTSKLLACRTSHEPAYRHGVCTIISAAADNRRCTCSFRRYDLCTSDDIRLLASERARLNWRLLNADGCSFSAVETVFCFRVTIHDYCHSYKLPRQIQHCIQFGNAQKDIQTNTFASGTNHPLYLVANSGLEQPLFSIRAVHSKMSDCV